MKSFIDKKFSRVCNKINVFPWPWHYHCIFPPIYLTLEIFLSWWLVNICNNTNVKLGKIATQNINIIHRIASLFYAPWFFIILRKYRPSLATLGVIRICSLLFRELLSLGCTYVQNLCGHLQEELLRIPKHPQLVKFGWFWAKLWHFEKRDVLR